MARTRVTRTPSRECGKPRHAPAASSRCSRISADRRFEPDVCAGIPALQLASGDRLTIAVGDFEGEPGRVSTTFDLPRVVRPGDRLLLDDGRLQLRVEKVESGRSCTTTVVDGGPLGEHKGINVPGVEFPATGLTDKDIADLQFGAQHGMDFVALSFVQSAAVLRQARDLLRDVECARDPTRGQARTP